MCKDVLGERLHESLTVSCDITYLQDPQETNFVQQVRLELFPEKSTDSASNKRLAFASNCHGL